MTELHSVYRVVGVFTARQQAERAGREAVRAGAAPDSVAIDDTEDERRSLQAEMQEEMQHTAASPGMGPFTKEMTKGMAVAVPVGSVAGLVIGLLAAAVPITGWSLLFRLVVYGLVGLICGGTIGVLVGGGLGAKGPAEKMASERGTVVGATAAQGDPAHAVAAAMVALGPIRVDLVGWTPGLEVGSQGYSQVVATEEDSSVSAAVHHLGDRVTQTEGEAQDEANAEAAQPGPATPPTNR